MRRLLAGVSSVLRLSSPLDVDGKLDEAVYAENEPFGDLVQVVPAIGKPATEQTDLWLMFDDRNIYFGARVHDSAPPDQWVANEYRRDTTDPCTHDLAIEEPPPPTTTTVDLEDTTIEQGGELRGGDVVAAELVEHSGTSAQKVGER